MRVVQDNGRNPALSGPLFATLLIIASPLVCAPQGRGDAFILVETCGIRKENCSLVGGPTRTASPRLTDAAGSSIVHFRPVEIRCATTHVRAQSAADGRDAGPMLILYCGKRCDGDVARYCESERLPAIPLGIVSSAHASRGSLAP